jgi:acyl-CoA hydrolase
MIFLCILILTNLLSMDISKHPSDSETIMTEVVYPNDTNPMGMLQGGKLVQWMDTASAICAQTHAGRICVTVFLDKVSFRSPAKTGDIITIRAKVTRAFSTSMEILVQAWSRFATGGDSTLISESYFTFVAFDDNARPVRVPKIVPVTADEKGHFNEALQRKAGRLNQASYDLV